MRYGDEMEYILYSIIELVDEIFDNPTGNINLGFKADDTESTQISDGITSLVR